MTEQINPGDIRRVNVEFALVDDDGTRTLSDPAIVELAWWRHRGPVTTWLFDTDNEIVRDEAGRFHADLDLTDAEPGLFHYLWSGDGAVQAVESGTFVVTPTYLPEEGS